VGSAADGRPDQLWRRKIALADATAWWHDPLKFEFHRFAFRLEAAPITRVIDYPPLSVAFARTNGMVYGFSWTSRRSIMGLEQLNWEAL
jgi:hypothetical protein